MKRIGPQIFNSKPVIAGPPGFVPSDLAGLMLWLEARYGALNNADILASNGEGIKTWRDQWEGASHLSQATSGLRPTLNTAPAVSFNGKPVISFDGVDDFLLRTTNPPAGPIMDGAGTTTFLVWATRDNNSHFNIPLSGGTSNGQLFFENAEAVADTSINMMMGSGANVLSSVYTYETKYHTTLIYNGASSKHWKNGVLVGTANAGTNSSDGISVGALRTGGEPFKGYIAALIVYNGAMDQADIDQVWAYLAEVYG